MHIADCPRPPQVGPGLLPDNVAMPKELSERLRTEAERRGVSEEQMINDVLVEYLSKLRSEKG